jgi:glycoside/pentoside/hexuronide:cation symporter, GPH family
MAEERLARATKILYGAGDTGFSLTSTLLAAYLAVFLTDVVGLAPGAAAVAILVGRSWDYINDPIIGHISDRTRSRWGRRRPFLLFGAIPFALAFTLLWARPPIVSQGWLAAYYALAYVLFDTTATFVYMPYFALTPELARGYDERTSLTTYRMFFSILASLVAFTVPLAFIGGFRPENAPRVFAVGVAAAVLSAAPLLAVFAGTRERQELMETAQPRLGESVRAAFANKPFRLGLGIYLGTWVAMDIIQAVLLYFLKYSLKREGEADLLMGTIFVTAIVALPLWGFLARTWGKKTAYIAGVVFWAAVQLVLISLGPATPLPVLVALCALAGVGVGAAHVLPWSILPDAIEWDEWRTGKRHEGMFYSVVTLAQKTASSIAIPLVLLLLQVSGYVANAPEQTAAASLMIRVAAGPVPMLLLVGGIACAAAYPLTRERFAEISAELAARRAARDGRA